MRKILTVVSLLFATDIFADEISLFYWGVNLNGTVSRSVSMLSSNVVFSDGCFETGLGTITMTFKSTTPADYSVAMYLDYEIDEPGYCTADSYCDSPDSHTWVNEC